jgi:hypothetical protein
MALRHGLHRDQLYDWRRQFRSDRGCRGRPCLVRFRSGGKPKGFGRGGDEIEIGGATVRVAAGIELGFLGKVLLLVKGMRCSPPSLARRRQGVRVCRPDPVH